MNRTRGSMFVARVIPFDAALWTIVGALAIGCAPATIGSVSPPSEQQLEVARQAGFEVSPVRRASELLPPEQRVGPHHEVREDVLHDGSAYVYSITSEFGDFEVRGEELLQVRLHEIDVLAAMRTTSKTAAFAAAVAGALTSPFVATWNLVTNPVDSVRGIPVRAWEALQHTADLARDERGELEGSGFAELIGFEAQKRRIAAELDVDPYTSNKVLQTQLNRFAWAAYAGSLPSMLVPFMPEPSSQATPDDRLTGILREYSPEDLRRLNRIELAVMGIPKPLSDQFIRHPWYSPRHETELVAALAGMDLAANRVAFIEAALTAGSERDANIFTLTARLLRAYSDRTSGIRSIANVDGNLVAYSADETLVLPLAADYAIWTPEMQTLVLAAAAPPPDQPPASNTALLVTGELSELARDRLHERGIQTTEHAFDELLEADMH